MIRNSIFAVCILYTFHTFSQQFKPVGNWKGAIIGHSDKRDYFVRAVISNVKDNFYKAQINIINSNYSGDFISDMQLNGDKLELLNFQVVKEYPKPYLHIKDCFTGYFKLMLLGVDSIGVLDLYRNPVEHSTLTDYKEDSITGEMIPAFECFNFVVLHNKIRDTAMQNLETRTDSLLAIKKAKTSVSSKRTTVTGKQFVTTNDSVTITVWDNNQIDGDSISLKLNDDWILTNQLLQREKLSMKVPVSGKQNELLLLAENLGKTPPNTAAITIQDKTTSKTFYLQSDFKKSEVLKIIKLSP